MESKTFDLAELLSKRGASVKEEEGPRPPAQETQPELFDPSPVRLSNETPAENEGRVILTQTATSSAPDFFSLDDSRKPQYLLKQEKPHHRVICYELAMGKTAGEIAKEFGFTPAMVYYVEKQPWAKEAVKNLIQQHGGDQVEKVLKGAALDAAEVLVRMKDDESAPHAVRINAAKEILDRIYGRSQQIVNHRKIDASDLTDEELAKLATSHTGGQ